MKKLITAILTLALCASLTAPAFAYQYGFESGGSTIPGFGKPTSNDDPVSPDPMSQNTRRNKDAASIPPGYGVFSGDIPTGQSSLYHDNFPGGMLIIGGGNDGGMGGAYGANPSAPGSSNVSVSQPGADGLMASTSTFSGSGYNTEPLFYDDGSIGTLYVAKLDKTIKIFEGESLENMKKGLGHFEFTSTYDGNVGLAGHNRGAAAYFSFVKDLAVGDKMIYTTKYGTRTYEVYNKVKISETDYSGLGWTADNIISMITCVENESSLRWLVQARQVD